MVAFLGFWPCHTYLIWPTLVFFVKGTTTSIYRKRFFWGLSTKFIVLFVWVICSHNLKNNQAVADMLKTFTNRYEKIRIIVSLILSCAKSCFGSQEQKISIIGNPKNKLKIRFSIKSLRTHQNLVESYTTRQVLKFYFFERSCSDLGISLICIVI